MVRDPDPEQFEDCSVEGSGECEWHEYPRVGEWVVARLSHSDESHVYIHFGGLIFCHISRSHTKGKCKQLVFITQQNNEW